MSFPTPYDDDSDFALIAISLRQITQSLRKILLITSFPPHFNSSVDPRASGRLFDPPPSVDIQSDFFHLPDYCPDSDPYLIQHIHDLELRERNLLIEQELLDLQINKSETQYEMFACRISSHH